MTPKEIQVCRRCLYTSRHPFGLGFDETGLCTGCITHQEKHELDWDSRFLLLKEMVHKACRRKKSPYYDCVVPIRGTPEYFYVVDVVKNRLGLNPLLVSYNSQFNSVAGIQNLDRIREVFDADILVYTSNPFTYRKLIRESLVRLNSMRWPFLAGETTFPVYEAVERDIPLVVWPYHQPTEQVGMHSYTEEPEMTRRGRAAFDLMGVEQGEFLAAETTITNADVFDLQYPANYLLDRHNIRGIYLANYLPWDTRAYSEEMIRTYGAKSAVNVRTFDTYDRIDDMTYMSVHDILKHAKHGYSRVTDNLCREIRFGRISRASAKRLEAYYQAQAPGRGLDVFLDWLGMTKQALDWFMARLPFQLPTGVDLPELSPEEKIFIESFAVNGPGVMDNNHFIVYGKGLEYDEVF